MILFLHHFFPIDLALTWLVHLARQLFWSILVGAVFAGCLWQPCGVSARPGTGGALSTVSTQEPKTQGTSATVSISSCLDYQSASLHPDRQVTSILRKSVSHWDLIGLL